MNKSYRICLSCECGPVKQVTVNRARVETLSWIPPLGGATSNLRQPSYRPVQALHLLGCLQRSSISTWVTMAWIITNTPQPAPLAAKAVQP